MNHNEQAFLFSLTNIKIVLFAIEKWIPKLERVRDHASNNISIMKRKKITEKTHTHTKRMP